MMNINPTDDPTGSTLKKARLERGLLPRELALFMRTTPRKVLDIERDLAPSREVVRRYLAALDGESLPAIVVRKVAEVVEVVPETPPLPFTVRRVA